MNIFFKKEGTCSVLENDKHQIQDPSISSQEELGFERNDQILLAVIFYFISCQIFAWCLLYYYHYFSV